MNTRDWVQDVIDFHKTFCEEVGKAGPWIPPADSPLAKLRDRLLKEELGELANALQRREVEEVTDAIADSIYVLVGTAIAYGIDLRPVWDEVHRSNMAKAEGGVRRDEGGKVIKPEGWKPPDIASALAKGSLRRSLK